MPTAARKPNFAKAQLKAIVERVERLEGEKKATSDDVRDVYLEAKGNGFDVRAIRTIVKMRKQDPDERREQQDIVDLYANSLGMLPLFEAAAAREKEIDDTKMTISAGGVSVETTVGRVKEAGKKLSKKDRDKLERKFPLMAG